MKTWVQEIVEKGWNESVKDIPLQAKVRHQKKGAREVFIAGEPIEDIRRAIEEECRKLLPTVRALNRALKRSIALVERVGVARKKMEREALREELRQLNILAKKVGAAPINKDKRKKK